MAKYKKRKDGRYQAQITIGVDPQTGLPKKKTIYATTIAELESKKAHVRSDLERGTYSDDKGTTVLKYAWKWFELNMSGKSESTKDGYRIILNNHMNYIGGLKLNKLTKSDILVELNKLEGKYETQRRFLMTLNQILESAIDDGLISKNVCRNIKSISNPDKKEKEPLSDFEMKCIGQANLNLRERCFISLLLYTGMRKGEILALNRQDINLKKGVITVNQAIEYINEKAHLKPPKTKAGYRNIPILSMLRPILERYLKTLEHPYFLFTSNTGELLTKSGARSFWNTIYRKISDQAGAIHQTGPNKKIIYLHDPLKGLTCHRFRHNFATIMYYSGIDVKEAARILGHSNLRVTLEVYTHLEQDKSHSVELLENYLKAGNN